MQSTPSSADEPGRRISRGAVVALIVVSLAIPGGVLAFALRGHKAASASNATNGLLPTPRKAKIGEAAPDFSLPGLDGKTVTLSKYRGKAVVLTFFASWCHPCEEDMPVLERAQQRDGAQVQVLGVNYQDFPNDTRDFVQRLHVTFPALIEDSTDNPVAARYDVHAMPDTLFIDAQGVVRQRLFGQVSTGDLDNAVRSLLGK